MVSFNFWSNSSSKTVGGSPQDSQGEDQSSHSDVDNHSTPQATLETSRTDVEEQAKVSKNTDISIPTAVPEPASKISVPSPPARRSFNFFQSHADHDHHKPVLTTEQERKKERQVVQDFKHAVLSQALNSDKRARESAEIVRSLIVGPMSIMPASKKTKPLSKAQLYKVKSDLAKPKSANKVIAHLRQLNLDSDTSSSTIAQPYVRGPIHAVCLDASDEEAAQRHFARLEIGSSPADQEGMEVFPSVVTASIESVTSLFNDLNVVSLLSSDIGLGEPVDGPGILSGAVPTAETIINGIEVITPQLLSLGYATGQAMFPDHKGIHPPTDRISVLTYWWGLEVVLPPPTLKHLNSVQSISHAVLNFLTVLAGVNNGVREILPFVRYISQFIEFEFNSIKAQDKGKGVVCAATWIMPAALVPRPWDFDPPANSIPVTKPANKDPATFIPDSTQPSGDSPFVIQPTEPSRSGGKHGFDMAPGAKVTPPAMGALPLGIAVV